jgi:competence protein ComEC
VSARPPPVAWLAIGYGSGVALALLNRTPPFSLLLLGLLALLIRTWPRPGALFWTALALPLGGLVADGAIRHAEADCRHGLADGSTLEVVGWFEARPGRGPAPMRVVDGIGCETVLRATLASDSLELQTGEVVRAVGRWRGSKRMGRDPGRRGALLVRSAEPVQDSGERPGFRTRARTRVEARVRRLFPSEWPLVDALLLAGTASLDWEVRDRFARAGVVHLLAISGFHVGVLAGGVLALGALFGASTPVAYTAGALVASAYVAFLGFPSAASRAGILLVGLALARARGAPVSGVGLLSTAFLALLLAEPLRLSQIGFQLSFAGALGLALFAGPWREALTRARVPAAGASGLAAGAAATVLTVPLVAIHFGEVSLVGIPMTLAVSPLFGLAIPWSILAVVLEPVEPVGFFVAGAAEAVLVLVREVVEVVGSVRWVVLEVGIPALTTAVGGLVLARAALRGAGKARRRVSIAVLALGLGAAVLLAPLGRRVVSADTVEVIMLDVGQGDAILVRTPRDRWILVDTGPRGLRFDAGRDVVAPFLKRRGIERLELLFLTHADLDHIGGAEAVLSSVEVGAVVDPGVPTGKDTYVRLLRAAEGEGVPWTRVRRGMTWTLDGVTVRALTPLPSARSEAPGPGRGGDASATNADSLVLLLEFGDFALLLTGDAPESVEAQLLRDGLLADVDVLKVGHHGSGTSTSAAFLAAVTPELALISAGRENRYGHPHASVLRRLHRSAVAIERTDRSGGIGVRADDSGAWEVRRGILR